MKLFIKWTPEPRLRYQDGPAQRLHPGRNPGLHHRGPQPPDEHRQHRRQRRLQGEVVLLVAIRTVLTRLGPNPIELF